MAVFRVEKTKDFTVMSNHHLRNIELSLKAKGLLSLVLSLPENWNYTTRGLASICKDGVDSISAAIIELETQGYITRNRIRNNKGQLTEIEYIIREKPLFVSPKLEKPERENPVLDIPVLVKPEQGEPEQENPVQLNKDISSIQALRKEELIIDRLNINPINPLFGEPQTTKPKKKDKIGLDKINTYREIIMDNVEYECLCERYSKERMDEVIELLTETVCSNREYITIASDDFPAEIVKSRLLKIHQFHVEYVFDCIDKNTTKVRNIKKYLLAALYNAPATMDSYYTTLVNHDMANGLLCKN